MQNVTEAVQDELVKSLDYKLGSSNVNYIQSRKDVQYFPSSLSTFTPTTSRVARIPLTSGMDFIRIRQNRLPGAQQLDHPGPEPRHAGALVLHQAGAAFCFAKAEQLRGRPLRGTVQAL